MEIFTYTITNTTDFWISRGAPASSAQSIVTEVLNGFSNPNIAAFYRIHGSADYQAALQYAIGQMIVGNFTFTDVQSYLYSHWNSITDSSLYPGRRVQLNAYRQSIGLQALSFYNCSSTGPSGGCVNNGTCIADGVCQCTYGFMGSDCSVQLVAQYLDYKSNGAAYALAILAAIGLFGCVSLAGLLFAYRQEKEIRSTSPVFNFLVLIGCTLGFITIYINIGMPTNSSCLADVWISFNALGMILGNLLAKNYRIYMIFMRTARPGAAQKMNDLAILKISAGIQFIEIVLLAVWSGVGAPTSTLVTLTSSSWYQTCVVSNSAGTALAAILAAYNVILVVAVLALAYATRSVKK